MKPVLENGVLGSDLDANHFYLLNLGAIVPTPANLALNTDPRLSDARYPLDGSISDVHIAAAAAIVQSKLSLNGNVPPAWLGTTSTKAAQGDLVEYIANRNQPNGYAGLDGTGKIPSANLPGTTGTGTVTSIGLTMPSQFSVSGSPVTAAGTLAAAWASVADNSWFGNKSGAPAAPQFYNTPLPAALIPSLDASIITSGVIPAARLPVAVGVGGSHASGAVPDPGASGGAADYLARDMTFKAPPTVGPTYQPTLANPIFGPSLGTVGAISVTFSHPVSDVDFFYSLTGATSGFVEAKGAVSLPAGSTIWCYAAHAGYNNSGVVSMTNTNPP